MPPPLRITTVRHGPDKARELLRTHIFGGKYKLPRVPRGVDPALVSEFILKEVKPDSPRDAYLKTLDTLRFYERPDVVDHLMGALNRREATYIDLMRSLFAVQIAGDIGSEAQRQAAANYLDTVIIPHALAEQAYPTIAQTLVVLAPAGSTAAFTQRVDREIKLREPLQNDSEAAMMAFDKSMEVKQQSIPACEKMIAGKTALLKKKPADRAADLVSIYLGKHELSDPYMSVWAARRIRFDVAEEGRGGGFAPHQAAFVKAIDAIDPKAPPPPPPPEDDMVLVRAVQAILYFQQAPGIDRLERYAKALVRPVIHLNFLWDDDE